MKTNMVISTLIGIALTASGWVMYFTARTSKVEAKAKYEEIRRVNDTTTSLLKRAQDSLSSCKKQTTNDIKGKQNNKGKR